MNYEEKFPNGFTNWQETHFEVVSQLTDILNQDEDTWPDKLCLISSMQGRGGMYELAENLTDEFERLHADTVWDGEFYDEIDKFIEEKLG